MDPSKHKNGAVLYYLKDQKGSDEEDFAKLREDIRKDLWREQENDLTKELLDGLKAKYHVKVNEERVEALNINAADDTYTDEPVITSDRQNVSEKQFMSVIRRLMNTREQAAHAASDEKAARDLKASTVDNIIAQSVTNWESLDRHFEEKEPFKWEYEFNYHHRLVQALEQRLFVPEAKVTDDEIKQYYQENIKRYTQPTLVKLYLIDETQGPIDQIWAEAATGVAFDKVAEKKGIKLKALETPVNHLDPEVKPMVEKMVDGETSPIFTAQGVKVIAHLLERTPETPLPLDRVKSSIRSHLSSEKIRQSRSAYLDKIKSQSKIEIKQRQWKAIQKELGGKK
ncbi:MAG: peptidylprolyl isomerase [Deltaproteobacteria bacterium]